MNGECYLKFNRKWDERWEDTKLVAKVGSQETPGVTGKFGLGIWNEAGQRLIEFCQKKCTDHNKHPLPPTQEKTLYMDITRWSTPKSDWLYSLYIAKDGEALYSQQKQDQELTVAQTMNSLLPNSDLNWRKWGKALDHSGMT